MAKSKTYIVSFSPAEKQPWGGYTIKISLLTTGTRTVIEAASLADLETKVRELANAYGKTCSPYVRLANKQERKPAGFDAWCNGLHIIEVAA